MISEPGKLLAKPLDLPGPTKRAPARSLWVLALVLITGGCATQVFQPGADASPAFIGRSVTQEIGGVRVSAAVPSAEETRSLTGIDLYASGIQPVWLSLENRDSRQVRIAFRSIDDEYFSPMEVAWTHRKPYNKESRVAMERWFYENAMPRTIPPGETRSGYVFTHVRPGTKGFNLDAYTSRASFNFTFFVPMPGFRPDYMDVDFSDLYDPAEIEEVDTEGLRTLLANHDCCSVNADESGTGDPFNVVIVASPAALRRGLLRSDWQETPAGGSETALARQHYYRGRIPDGTFHKSRPDGSERKELRIWLSPMHVEGRPVWLAQASYDMSGANGEGAFTSYQIDPDIDDARMYVMQTFWYSQSLAKLGLSSGVPPASIDEPSRNFLGNSYFTDGNRVVMFVIETPVAMDETEILEWERLVD